MTIRLEFPPDTLSILNGERYTHPAPLVQRRMDALWLKSHNLPRNHSLPLPIFIQISG
jgi:hypothetical protein